MRLLVSALLVLHGVIHLIGAFRPAAVASRVPPAAWLTAAAVLWIAALLLARRVEGWWILAVIAVVISQVLIAVHWRTAWAGTAVNVLLLFPIVVGAGLARFHASDARAVTDLLASAEARPRVALTEADLASLPAPVQRWLRASGAVGRPVAHTVRLQQRGIMRTSPTGPGMTVSAEQHFTVEPPGFVWAADVRLFHVVPIVGRDAFSRGAGHMTIKVGGLVTVADGVGPKFDQGTALRFLGEIIWFPSAATSSHIRWQPVDDRRAEATLDIGTTRVSATFEFDERDRFVKLSADRYLNGQTLERWEIPATEWRVIRGIEIPTRGGAVWKLAAGDFNYYDWEITDVEADPRR